MRIVRTRSAHPRRTGVSPIGASHTSARGVAALALAALVLSSCVTTDLPPASSAGAAFEPLPDEAALWARARGEERDLRRVVALRPDPELEAYLQEVVDRLTPPGLAANPHLRYTVSVIDAPEANAFAYPHGALYVHAGLLAGLDNEDQLATLLGHEMSHVENRHMLRHQRAMRNREVGFTAASVAVGILLDGAEAELWWDGDYAEAMAVGVIGDLLIGMGLELALVASVNGYGRELEYEADRGGIAMLDRAGYDLAEAPRFYAALRDRAAPAAGPTANYFFGSHPRLELRVEAAQALVAERQRAAVPTESDGDDAGEAPAAGLALASHAPAAEPSEPAASAAASGSASGAAPGEEASDAPLSAADRRFRRNVAPVVRDQAWWHLSEGRLDAAQEHWERAAAWAPDDPPVHLLRGQLRLAQSDAAPSPEEESWLRDDAGRAFLEAIRLDPDLPEAHRDLGMMLYDDGDPGAACRELGFYLELDPEAPDADWVEGYVEELVQLGYC